MKIRKLYCLLLALLMIILCCGCGEKEETESDNSSSSDNSSFSKPVMTETQLEYKDKLPKAWQRAINHINTEKEGKFIFAIQTDTHFAGSDEEAGINLSNLSNTIDLSFYAHLGDIIRGYEDPVLDDPDNMRKSMDEMVRRYTEGANCPVMMTVGNHDANSMWFNKYNRDVTGLITEKEHYSRIVKPLKEHNGEKMVNNGESVYHYIDFPEYQIRAIMLNTTDSKFSNGQYSTFNISGEQVSWFEKEALDTDYSVLVMAHVPLIDSFSEKNRVSNSERILEAVENFVNGGGDFIAYFYGHTHEQEEAIDGNGRVHLSFKKGGEIAEVVMIDKEERQINTVGLGNVRMRNKIEY